MFNLFNGVHFPTIRKSGIKYREFIFGVSFYFLQSLFNTNNKTIIVSAIQLKHQKKLSLNIYSKG